MVKTASKGNAAMELLSILKATQNLPAVYKMVTKDRLARLIGEKFSATEKTATQELHNLAHKKGLLYDIRQCGENDSAHVFECIFGTYKTKVIFFKHSETLVILKGIHSIIFHVTMKITFYIESQNDGSHSKERPGKSQFFI